MKIKQSENEDFNIIYQLCCRLTLAMDIIVKTSLPMRTINPKCGLRTGLVGKSYSYKKCYH